MAAKKSFKNENPAMQFIGQSGGVDRSIDTGHDKTPIADVEPPPHQATQVATLPPMKPNPLYIETKSRRLNLLVQPSLHDKIKGIAKGHGASVNDTIHQILQSYVDAQKGG